MLLKGVLLDFKKYWVSQEGRRQRKFAVMLHLKQYWGSVTFWYGSGTLVHLYHSSQTKSHTIRIHNSKTKVHYFA